MTRFPITAPFMLMLLLLGAGVPMERGETREPTTAEVLQMDAEVRHTLATPVRDMDFRGTAFKDVIDVLRETKGANIFTNFRTLEAAGVRRDLPVTLKIHGLTLAEALNNTLAEVGGDQVQLAYATDGGTVTISTYANLNTVTTRVYANTRPADPESLVREVEGIDPLSWRNTGGDIAAISILAGRKVCVITQTIANHRRLEEMLGKWPNSNALPPAAQVVMATTQPSGEAIPSAEVEEPQYFADQSNENTLKMDAPVRKKLASPMPDLDLRGTSFSDFIELLQKSAGDIFFVNYRALESVRVKPDLRITTKLHGLTLAQVLDKTLCDIAGNHVLLGYQVSGGVIAISTRDQLNAGVVRVYTNPRPTETAQLIRELEGIDPLSWRVNGGNFGAIRAFPEDGELLVTQTMANHRRIEELLGKAKVQYRFAAAASPATIPSAGK